MDEIFNVSVKFSKESLDLFFSSINLKPLLNNLKANKINKILPILDNSNKNVIHNTLIYCIHHSTNKCINKILNRYYSKESKFSLDINHNKSEALKYALYYNKHQLVKSLILCGCDIHTENDYALVKYCEIGNVEMVEFLISRGADIHVNDDIVLLIAAEQGYLSLIKLLISNGLTINNIESINATNFDLALICATKNNHNDIILFMLEHGANPNINDGEALINCCNFENKIGIELLLRYKVNINVRNGAPIIICIKKNNIDCVNLIVNYSDDDGIYFCNLFIDDSSPLRWAVYKGFTNIVSVILNAKNLDGSPRCDIHANENECFHLAEKYKYHDIMKLLENN